MQNKKNRSSLTGFILILLGGISSIILAVNFLGPSLKEQALSIFLTLTGALLIVFSFRVKRI